MAEISFKQMTLRFIYVDAGWHEHHDFLFDLLVDKPGTGFLFDFYLKLTFHFALNYCTPIETNEMKLLFTISE